MSNKIVLTNPHRAFEERVKPHIRFDGNPVRQYINGAINISKLGLHRLPDMTPYWCYGDIRVGYNYFRSFEGLPSKVSGIVFAENCHFLESLEHLNCAYYHGICPKILQKYHGCEFIRKASRERIEKLIKVERMIREFGEDAALTLLSL